MASDSLILKYDGGDADHHAIDMGLLGQSLQGIDRILSELIIAVTAGRPAKRGERAPLVIKAHEPKPGTVTVPVVIQEAAHLLQLGWQVFGSDGGEILANWIKGILLLRTDRKAEGEAALRVVAELAENHTSALQQVEQNRHAEMMGMQELLGKVADRLGPATIQTVAPIGPSVRRLLFFSPKQGRISIEQEDADAIRAKAELEWTGLLDWHLRTDGFVFHTKRLSIEHPDEPGWFSAEVEDPVAEIEANPYASAAQRKAAIRATGKAAYRAGKLERLILFHFGEEIGRAA